MVFGLNLRLFYPIKSSVIWRKVVSTSLFSTYRCYCLTLSNELSVFKRDRNVRNTEKVKRVVLYLRQRGRTSIRTSTLNKTFLYNCLYCSSLNVSYTCNFERERTLCQGGRLQTLLEKLLLLVNPSLRRLSVMIGVLYTYSGLIC